MLERADIREVSSSQSKWLHVALCCPSLLLPLPQISQLPGVVYMQDAHVWSLCTGNHHASLHLKVLPSSDPQSITAAARSTLKQVNPRVVSCSQTTSSPPNDASMYKWRRGSGLAIY